MTAFGPYKDKEVIDFTQLHEHGIFVVSGSTGAGKTTIFDAITFALYDTGSGEDREKSLFLRSDFADATVDTEVELIFEVKSRMYRIWRKFGHDGASAKREFYDITGGINEPVVEKFQVKLVQSKVEELIGLTQSQFNQIVMLPQGEFQKLLTSESKHKEEIFRKIFKTERFTKMVELLRDKKRMAEKAFDQAKSQQEHLIVDIKSRLPERESELFLIINSEAINMYQVEQALNDEQHYYEQQKTQLQQSYEQLKQQLKEQNEAYSEQKLLNERIEKFRQRQQQLNELKEQQHHFDEQQHHLDLAVKGSHIEPLEREYLRAKELHIQAQQLLEKDSTEHNNAVLHLQNALASNERHRQQEPLLATYTKNISQLEQLVPIYQSMDELRANVQKLVKEQQQGEQLFNQLTEQEKTLKEQHKNQLAIEKTIMDDVSQYQQIFEQHAQYVQKTELVRETIQYEKSVQVLLQETENKRIVAQQAQQAYDKIEAQIRNNQAAFIASTLHAGEACPVCGSLEHPAIHNKETLEVDEQLVDELRQQAHLTMQNYYQVKSKLEIDAATLQTKQAQIKVDGLSTDELQQYESQRDHLAGELQRLKQLQQQLLQEKKKSEDLVQQLEKVQARLENGRNFVTQINTQLAQEKGKLEQSEKSLLPQFETVTQVNSALSQAQENYQLLKQQIERAAQQLQQAQLDEKTCAVNLQHAKTRVMEQQKQQEITQQAFQQALIKADFSEESYRRAILSEEQQQTIRQAIEQFKQSLHTLKVQIEEDTPQLEHKALVDLTAWQQQITELDQQVEKHYGGYKLAESYVVQCQTTKQNLAQVAEQIELYKSKLMQVEHVYDLIRGQNEAKISFERFAQIGYLEKVTHAANERLRTLSNGQYFLKSTGRKEGNAQSGLSIDVFDSNTGQTRDVKTLSGGEKFNASLALALGMADVIQSVQGSVHIDTMFIDEGFGTLDEEALRRAIDILIDLQQSGRLIGVISHVAELKAAMPAILQVNKLKEGHSRTEIIVK